MKNLSSFVLIIALTCSASFSVLSGETNTIEIDLINAKLNGKNLDGMSLETVTDILGRPSETRNTIIGRAPNAETYTELFYLSKGLKITFNGEKVCGSINIYFTKKWNPNESDEALPFTGKLSKGLDVNWKVKKFMEEFSEFNPKDMSTDVKKIESAKKSLALAVMLPETSKDLAKSLKISATEDLYHIEVKKPGLTLYYEPNSKFIERFWFHSFRRD